MSNLGPGKFIWDRAEADRARAVTRRNTSIPSHPDSAHVMAIDQRAVLRAMRVHGPDCIRDEGFMKEQAEAYPEIVANPKHREYVGSVARRVWGTRRCHDCKGGKLREILKSGKAPHAVIR